MSAAEELRSHNGKLHGNKENIGNNQTDMNKSWIFALLMNLTRTWRTWSVSLDQMLEHYGAYEVIDFVVQHLSKHPFLAFFISMCVLSCALPFIIFMVFAIATVIMTFTGFVIIEGTLITIASALMFGFLGSIIIFFLFISFVMMAGYFGLVQIYDMFDYPNKRRAVIQFFRGKPTTNSNSTEAKNNSQLKSN